MEWTAVRVQALRAACRLTREEFADALGAAPKSVQNWETGAVGKISHHMQRALDTVLERAAPSQRQDFEQRVRGLSVRDMTEQSSALASTFAVSAGGIDDGRGGRGHGADQAELVDGIRAAIETRKRSGRIDPARVADLATMAALHRRSYRDIPAAQLLRAAQAHLSVTWSLRPDYQPDQTRRPLLTVIGEMAALVSTLLLLDHQRPGDAQRYIELAWSAAVATADSELQAVVLGVRSFNAAYAAGDHRAGLEFARHACDIAATGASGETRGWVAAVASERYASLGDVVGCQRWLESSHVALAEPVDETPVLGIGEFTIDKLAAYEGGDLVRMGRYREAEPSLDAAIEKLGPYMQRHRCTALIDRAEARLGAGELDGACHDGQAALDLVTQVQHAGNFKRIRALAQHARAGGGTAARDLWHNVLATTHLTHPD